MLLSIYISLPGNFGYLLSVPSTYDNLVIGIAHSYAIPGIKASRSHLLENIFLSITASDATSPSDFSSCTVIESLIFALLTKNFYPE